MGIRRSIQQLQQLVSRELDLLVPPLGGSIVGGDQPCAVQAAQVAVGERVSGLGLVGSTLGETQVPRGVLAPGV
jgi:hypothetical protein